MLGTQKRGREREKRERRPPYPLTNPFGPISEADCVYELTGVVHSHPTTNSTSKSQNKIFTPQNKWHYQHSSPNIRKYMGQIYRENQHPPLSWMDGWMYAW